MERKFPYLRIRVTDGEVGKLPIRKKNPGELLGRWPERASRSPGRTATRHPTRVLSRLPYGRCTAADRPNPSRSGDR